MVLAARLSHQIGYFESSSCDRAIALIESAGLPTTMPDIVPAVMLEHMGRDKKNEGGNIRLILIKQIGISVVDASVSAERIRTFLETQRPSH